VLMPLNPPDLLGLHMKKEAKDIPSACLLSVKRNYGWLSEFHSEIVPDPWAAPSYTEEVRLDRPSNLNRDSGAATNLVVGPLANAPQIWAVLRELSGFEQECEVDSTEFGVCDEEGSCDFGAFAYPPTGDSSPIAEEATRKMAPGIRPPSLPTRAPPVLPPPLPSGGRPPLQSQPKSPPPPSESESAVEQDAHPEPPPEKPAQVAPVLSGPTLADGLSVAQAGIHVKTFQEEFGNVSLPPLPDLANTSELPELPPAPQSFLPPPPPKFGADVQEPPPVPAQPRRPGFIPGLASPASGEDDAPGTLIDIVLSKATAAPAPPPGLELSGLIMTARSDMPTIGLPPGAEQSESAPPAADPLKLETLISALTRRAGLGAASDISRLPGLGPRPVPPGRGGLPVPGADPSSHPLPAVPPPNLALPQFSPPREFSPPAAAQAPPPDVTPPEPAPSEGSPPPAPGPGLRLSLPPKMGQPGVAPRAPLLPSFTIPGHGPADAPSLGLPPRLGAPGIGMPVPIPMPGLVSGHVTLPPMPSAHAAAPPAPVVEPPSDPKAPPAVVKEEAPSAEPDLQPAASLSPSDDEGAALAPHAAPDALSEPAAASTELPPVLAEVPVPVSEGPGPSSEAPAAPAESAQPAPEASVPSPISDVAERPVSEPEAQSASPVKEVEPAPAPSEPQPRGRPARPVPRVVTETIVRTVQAPRKPPEPWHEPPPPSRTVSEPGALSKPPAPGMLSKPPGLSVPPGIAGPGGPGLLSVPPAFGSAARPPPLRPGLLLSGRPGPPGGLSVPGRPTQPGSPGAGSSTG
jgi:hypothetical protein